MMNVITGLFPHKKGQRYKKKSVRCENDSRLKPEMPYAAHRNSLYLCEQTLLLNQRIQID
jgi:hypothetical protein